MEADAGGLGKCISPEKNCIYALMSSIKCLLEEVSRQHADAAGGRILDAGGHDMKMPLLILMLLLLLLLVLLLLLLPSAVYGTAYLYICWPMHACPLLQQARSS